MARDSSKVPQQKSKKWFKPKKPHKTVKRIVYDNWGYIDEDFYNTNFTSYDGYNHKNRDRVGGHITTKFRYGFYKTTHNKRNRLKNNQKINEGLQDYYDEIQEIEETIKIAWEEYINDFYSIHDEFEYDSYFNYDWY